MFKFDIVGMSQAVVQYVMILSVSRASNFTNLLAPRASGFRSLMSCPVRGQPSLGSPTANLPPKRKRKVQKKTNDDIRKDGIDHLPLWEEKRQRCAMCPGPAAFSYVKCQKCQVWLCLNKDRNCFRKFHA